jgi:alanyl-tRNA synthetase
MGLERIVSVVQNADTNFDTDLLRPIIARTEELTALAFGLHRRRCGHEGDCRPLAGGGLSDRRRVLPSNEGRGYVLRRIMRRAIRYGRRSGSTGPFWTRPCGWSSRS